MFRRIASAGTGNRSPARVRTAVACRARATRPDPYPPPDPVDELSFRPHRWTAWLLGSGAAKAPTVPIGHRAGPRAPSPLRWSRGLPYPGSSLSLNYLPETSLASGHRYTNAGNASHHMSWGSPHRGDPQLPTTSRCPIDAARSNPAAHAARSSSATTKPHAPNNIAKWCWSTGLRPTRRRYAA